MEIAVAAQEDHVKGPSEGAAGVAGAMGPLEGRGASIKGVETKVPKLPQNHWNEVSTAFWR